MTRIWVAAPQGETNKLSDLLEFYDDARTCKTFNLKKKIS